ncbi:MAG: hypothetical protein AAFQ82_09975 [Myxococcota bacterium]
MISLLRGSLWPAVGLLWLCSGCSGGATKPVSAGPLEQLLAPVDAPESRQKALSDPATLSVLAAHHDNMPAATQLLRQAVNTQWFALPNPADSSEYHQLYLSTERIADAADHVDPAELFQWTYEVDFAAEEQRAAWFLRKSEALYLATLAHRPSPLELSAEDLERLHRGAPSDGVLTASLARETLKGFRSRLQPSTLRVQIGGEKDNVSRERAAEDRWTTLVRFAPRGVSSDPARFFGLIGEALLTNENPDARPLVRRTVRATFEAIASSPHFPAAHSGRQRSEFNRRLASLRILAAMTRFETRWLLARGASPQATAALYAQRVEKPMHGPLRPPGALGASVLDWHAAVRGIWLNAELERRFGAPWWHASESLDWLIEHAAAPLDPVAESDAMLRWLESVAQNLLRP